MGVLRVAPVGLYTYLSSLPRVWSPLQGYAPWALEGVAPLGFSFSSAQSIGGGRLSLVLGLWVKLKEYPSYP